MSYTFKQWREMSSAERDDVHMHIAESNVADDIHQLDLISPFLWHADQNFLDSMQAIRLQTSFLGQRNTASIEDADTVLDSSMTELSDVASTSVAATSVLPDVGDVATYEPAERPWLRRNVQFYNKGVKDREDRNLVLVYDNREYRYRVFQVYALNDKVLTFTVDPYDMTEEAYHTAAIHITSNPDSYFDGVDHRRRGMHITFSSIDDDGYEHEYYVDSSMPLHQVREEMEKIFSRGVDASVREPISKIEISVRNRCQCG